ncbi:MAG: YihY/virulence factor BrkB family protein [Bacteroidales bacterium]|nr:YihY/virulence factor BrkB family protein [Bacteroidales bacterium]
MSFLRITFFRIIIHLINWVWQKITTIIQWSKKVVLPGLDGMPLYEVMRFFILGLMKGQLTRRASAIAYNFFMAIFPTIIFFFTIIPFIPVENFQGKLLTLLRDLLPTGTYSTVNETLTDIITRPRSGLLSIGFVLALYFSTNGIASMMDGFNSTRHSIETRSWFKQRLVATMLVLLLSLMVIFSIALISIGGFTFQFLHDHGILNSRFTYYLLQSVRWLTLVSLIFFGTSMIYYFGPARQNKFRFFSAGSTLATFLIVASLIGFNYYVANFSSYNALYGSIGTLLIVMLWIYFNSLIFLIGFELNVSIGEAGAFNEESEALMPDV